MEIKVNLGDKLINILSHNALVAGGGECRRLFAIGGISLNGEKISDSNKTLDKTDFRDGEAIIQVGRKKLATLVCGQLPPPKVGSMREMMPRNNTL